VSLLHRAAGERDEVTSVPQTPAQVTLGVVSAVMAILGGVVLLAGGLVLFAAITGQVDASDSGLAIAGVTLSGWSPMGLAIVTLAAGALLCATAWLGFAASRDSSRVGPYRFLCYLVGLVLLVAILWSWGSGTILIFNPIVLSTTITYVVVCSSLADRVQREHDDGVRGESFLLSGHQRALRLISQVMIVTAVLNAVITLIVWYAVSQMDPTAQVTLAEAQYTAGRLSSIVLGWGLASAAVNLLVGLLGLRGANQPEKIRPFLWVSAISFAYAAVQLVLGIVTSGGMGSVQSSSLTDALFYGACTYLSVKIRRQPQDREGQATGGEAENQPFGAN
jgi:MFS family permease